MAKAAQRGTKVIMASMDGVGQNGIGLLIDMAVLAEIWNGVAVVVRNGIEITGGVNTIRTKIIGGLAQAKIMAVMDVATKM
jgi:hypothetical protein